jgi:hypothetical protein
MHLIPSVFAVCFALAGAGCSRPAGQQAEAAVQTDSIFRYLSIGPGVVVRLGEPLPGLAWPFIQQTGHDRYAVRKGTFAGAAAIELRLDAAGRMTAAVFTYGAGDEGFAAKVASYSETLGPPVRTVEEGTQVARWEDGRTRFELSERGGRVTALLRDLPRTPPP